PGVNDGERLLAMCEWLEERGAKGLILMRFANRIEQGLILENAPIIRGQRVHTVEEFQDLVTDLNHRFSMKISGTPLWDPSIGSPFAILEEPDLLATLPRVEKRASVITGSIAAPYIQRVLDACGEKDLCRVVPTEKEIACLITAGDLRDLDPGILEETVIIPGRAFVHLMEAEEVLGRDGVSRTIVRGPEMLTADAETSMGMDRQGVLHLELEGLAALIRLINRYGT
ncbi:MAG: methanogenesis-associated radical SAM protein, partial [Methanomicrobiaceae archaeon]|nr:methanogenesis-associated radical SAM protein [Methanomicrobiaceae archaeon]